MAKGRTLTTTKRRMPQDEALRREIVKQARRERLVFRLIERNARWVRRQAKKAA